MYCTRGKKARRGDRYTQYVGGTGSRTSHNFASHIHWLWHQLIPKDSHCSEDLLRFEEGGRMYSVGDRTLTSRDLEAWRRRVRGVLWGTIIIYRTLCRVQIDM